VVREIVEAALFIDNPVLVTGESGTGKELVARLIHTLDRRPQKGELIVLDCTTVVPTLSGSEFFGHERGAFTGAVNARDGAFGQADGGTLFLDEIGELPLTLQAELLRVIQEGTYKRVGSDTWRTTRFRLVSATNRPLADAMAAGTFRADLYHRIAAWTFELPPLRERPGDVSALARHFLSELRPGGDLPALDPAVERHLATRLYPGNVRELRLLMARIAARHVGPGPITLGDLPTAERTLRTGSGSAAPVPSASSVRLDRDDMPDRRGDRSTTADRGPRTAWHDALQAGVAQAVDAGIGLEALGRLAKDLAVARVLEDEHRDTARTARRLGISERAVQARLAASRRDAGPRSVGSSTAPDGV
jgi:transcriptional regulator with GAF, ATPase, and Fis domain